MSIRLNISYTRCSNCELKKSIKLYFDTVIEPKDGVYESSMNENYCENCENFTKWFMGKGVRKMVLWDPNYSSTKSKIQKNEDKLKKVSLEIIKLEEIKINFFLKLIYNLKLNSLRSEKKLLEIDLYKLNNIIEDSLDSDSIKFYNKLNPKPKCLECGYDKLYEKPKHTCGGNIYSQLSENVIIKSEQKTNIHLEYDEYGNVNEKKIMVRQDGLNSVLRTFKRNDLK